MKFLRPFLTVVVILIVASGVFLWWNFPGKSDLTEYAPADAVVYVEINSLTDIADALKSGDVWKTVAIAATGAPPTPSNRLYRQAARAGIGPAAGVLLSRSQFALIVLNMNTTEENESLKVKPEFALVAETHTASWRVKGPAKEAIKQLATTVYGNSSCADRNNAGVELFECGGDTPERKIVATVDGSVVIVGNTEKAVQTVLEVRRGARASLKTNAELQLARSSAGACLAFGYVPHSSAPKLFAWAAPLVLGSEASNSSLQKLLENSLSKMIGSISWTARTDSGIIEDSFTFGLESDVVAQLRPAFVTRDPGKEFWEHIPGGVSSLSLYQSQTPLTAWDSLNTSIALKLDTVQSVVIGTVFRSALGSYGIGNAREFLGTVQSPLITMKSTEAPEGSVLIGHVTSKENLRKYLSSEYFADGKGRIYEKLAESAENNTEYVAVLDGEWVTIGKGADVAAWSRGLQNGRLTLDAKTSALFTSGTDKAAVLTWGNDSDRVQSFVNALLTMEKLQLSEAKRNELNKTTFAGQFAFTQSVLTDTGLQRKTRSAFGQFSTLTSVLNGK